MRKTCPPRQRGVAGIYRSFAHFRMGRLSGRCSIAACRSVATCTHASSSGWSFILATTLRPTKAALIVVRTFSPNARSGALRSRLISEDQTWEVAGKHHRVLHLKREDSIAGVPNPEITVAMSCDRAELLFPVSAPSLASGDAIICSVVAKGACRHGCVDDDQRPSRSSVTSYSQMCLTPENRGIT